MTKPAPASTPLPIIRAAAPRNAPPAVDARSIGGSGVAAPSIAAPVAPFSVAIAAQDGLQDVANAVVAGLLELGINARTAELAKAGRPDVILALAAVPGGRNEAWFCDPGPDQSSVLAYGLLEAAGPGEEVAPPADVPLGEFPCDEVHAGRAQVPAVLLELAEVSAHVPGVIVSGLESYFQKQRAQVLAARAAPRLAWPALGPVTSHYSANHPLGIDIGQSAGPITAATDGVVTFAGGNVCCSYGLYVVVEGQDGIGTLYAHLSAIAVTEGQRVRQGEILGEVGCTGTCFGTHLHFEVFQSDRRQNPMRFLP